MDRQEGSCLASFQIVDREGDHVVDVYIVETPWVYVNVHYQLVSDSERDVVLHGFGGRDEILGGGM